MPPRSSLSTPRGGSSLAPPSRGRRGRPSISRNATGANHLLSPPPSFELAEAPVPAHRNTSSLPDGRRGRKADKHTNGEKHTSPGPASSPDPLALSVSPEVVKRGRKRKSALLDPDVHPEGGNQVGDGADVEQEAGQGPEGTGENGEAKKVEDFTEEEKQDMWLDFAAERYEIVEQLPLELHRNFRLLRELDDGCISQSEKLQEQMRAYIAARFELVRRIDAVAEALASADAADPAQAVVSDVEMETTSAAENPPAIEGEKQEDGAQVVGPADGAVSIPQEASGSVCDDAEERILLVAGAGEDIADQTGTEHDKDVASKDDLGASPAVPSVPQETEQSAPLAANGDDVGEANGSNSEAKSQSQPLQEVPPEVANDTPPPANRAEGGDRPRPSRFLPEIGRLAREIVRNCEEKVAVAQGAYNSIDRHIRALDSHLSAQEASLILGLRPDTLPSAGADAAALGPAAGAEAGLGQAMPGEGDGEVLSLGIGGGAVGGGGRVRKRKGKPGRKGAAEAAAQVAGADQAGVDGGMGLFGALAFEVADADPNEPRYCYCNRVSYGDMVACENDDCPIEWFHLPCTGLAGAPQGKWWCNVCKPKPGFVPPGETVFLAAQAAKEGSAVASGASAVVSRPKKKGRRR